MINAIGEAVMQHSVRAEYSSEIHDKDLVARKADQIRKKRPVQKSDDSSKPEMNLQHEENITKKNILEEGMLIVEQYDDSGRLIRKIPPGYLPFGEKIV